MNPKPTSTDPRRPESFPRRVLVATLGLAPQVLTETLWALATASPAFVPTEVHAVTTSEGRAAARTVLLGDEGSLAALAADLGLPALAGVLADERVHVIGGGRLLPDIDSEADSAAAADLITRVVRAVCDDDNAAVHVSIAGGRKTMGFLAGYALSLFGRPQDRLSHVLVAEPFQSHPLFHFPPRRPVLLETRGGATISTAEADVVLARIPVVRLRGHLPGPMLAGDVGYSRAVAEAQRVLDPPVLRVDLANRRLICGGIVVKPRPFPFAFAAWLAARARAHGAEAGAVHWLEADWNELAAMYRRLGLRDPPLAGAGVDKEWFSEQKSRLTATLKRTLGEAADPYLPKTFGTRPGTRTGFDLEPQQIEISDTPTDRPDMPVASQ